MSTHLVIGAAGQVGEHLAQALVQAGHPVAGADFLPAAGIEPLDIRDLSQVQALVERVAPAVVYLPAALTNVDYCELHPAQSYGTNVLGVANVVAAANAAGARLVYFSSDYVFDGRAGPYTEAAPANPINEYGRHKLLAEHHIGLHARDYLIVRTTGVFGWERQGKNFVYRLWQTLSAGQPVRVPVDQVANPTYAPNLAAVTVDLAGAGARGVYNVVGPERLSRYEFACAAAETFGLDPRLVQPVATSELGQAAARPLNAGLVVDKVQARTRVPLVGCRAGLQAMRETQPA